MQYRLTQASIAPNRQDPNWTAELPISEISLVDSTTSDITETIPQLLQDHIAESYMSALLETDSIPLLHIGWELATLATPSTGWRKKNKSFWVRRSFTPGDLVELAGSN